MPYVSGSSKNYFKTSMKFVPLKGSPPIPTTVDCPRLNADLYSKASCVRVTDLETIPIFPFLCIYSGIIPI
jgi:hypothetical protein